MRIAVSYDIAWFKRGSGNNYDSLSGFGCMIGHFTRKIIDYGCRNRKCKKCDLGHSTEDHDCRRNFAGAAKGVESDLAVSLMCNSNVLKESNLQVGIFSGDDDAASIAKVRSASSHPDVKLLYANHIGKGITGQLYKLKLKHKELTTEAINCLKRCFSFAVAQNVGRPDILV